MQISGNTLSNCRTWLLALCIALVLPLTTVQAQQGKLITLNGKIDYVAGNTLLLNDFEFQLTPDTQVYSSAGTPVGISSLKRGMHVEAVIQGPQRVVKIITIKR